VAHTRTQLLATHLSCLRPPATALTPAERSGACCAAAVRQLTVCSSAQICAAPDCTKPAHTFKLHLRVHSLLCWCPAGASGSAQRTHRPPNAACQRSSLRCSRPLHCYCGCCVYWQHCSASARNVERGACGSAVRTGCDPTSGACDVREAWWWQQASSSSSSPRLHCIGSTNTQANSGCLGAQARPQWHHTFRAYLQPASCTPHSPP
jgi:hypothetical protein